MKRIVVVLLALLLLSTAAMSADQNNWRVFIKADDGSGMSSGSGTYVGVYPTSVDGKDTQDGSPFPFSSDVPGTTMILETAIPGEAPVYSHNIQAPTFPCPEKTWDLYIAGNWNSSRTQIRLRAFTVNNALPTPTYTHLGVTYPVKYFMRMVDNKGVEGSPTNGTMWELPTPTAHTALVPYWDSPVNLPMIKLSVGDSAHLLAEGYKMQFVQQAIPEPSGLLALGGCLVGLAGFIRRRR
jgi:hypothetical protein